MPCLLPSLRALLILTIIGCSTSLFAQTNLLRNGGFEQIEIDTGMYNIVNSEAPSFKLNDTAITWSFCNKKMVIVCSRDWTFRDYNWNANLTYYTDSGYSHSGKLFALISAYDICSNQRLEIHNLCGRLCSPLLAGHKYKVSFYLKAFEGNAFANQLSVAFAENYTDNIFVLDKKEISKKGKEVSLHKAYTVPGILTNKDYQQFSFEYTAIGNEQYLYIGNFHLGYMEQSDCKKTDWFGPWQTPRRFPYIEYAIDDIVVNSVDTSERCQTPVIEINTTVAKSEPDTLLLQTIYFDYNDSISTGTFTKIADTLKKFKSYRQLLVYGYTDNTGSLEYNQRLSEQRATFVAKQLHALTNKNINAKGEGLSKDVIEPRLQRRVDVYAVK